MKSISIYYYKDKIFILPKSVLKNGPKIITAPIFNTIIDRNEITLGITSSFQYCGYLNEEPSENYFNTFLKLSKAKTNKNLVENGKLVSISEDGEHYFLTYMASNLKYKSFEGKVDIKFEKSQLDIIVDQIIQFFKPDVDK